MLVGIPRAEGLESNRPERRVSRYGVDLGTVGASREPAKSPWLFRIEHKCQLQDTSSVSVRGALSWRSGTPKTGSSGVLSPDCCG